MSEKSQLEKIHVGDLCTLKMDKVLWCMNAPIPYIINGNYLYEIARLKSNETILLIQINKNKDNIVVMYKKIIGKLELYNLDLERFLKKKS